MSVNSPSPLPEETLAERIRHQELRLWTEEEVAMIFNISVKTLRNWRSLRIGPAWTKFGHRVHYPQDGVADYLEQNTHVTQSEEGKVGVPLYGRQPASESSHRFGGHRTKQEKSRAS